MAVFGVAPANNLDEIKQYQMGRYISSNEAIWRIFSFPIHERYPTVLHLAVHLENGQRVYFTTENVAERAAQPPATTLTAFFRCAKPMTLLKLYCIRKFHATTPGMHPESNFNDASKDRQ